jgi:hypothetical protein
VVAPSLICVTHYFHSVLVSTRSLYIYTAGFYQPCGCIITRTCSSNGRTWMCGREFSPRPTWTAHLRNKRLQGISIARAFSTTQLDSPDGCELGNCRAGSFDKGSRHAVTNEYCCWLLLLVVVGGCCVF